MPYRLLLRIPVIFVLVSLTLEAEAQQVDPIPYAHAHNDYEHERPLFDALAHGFTSIEVDVFAIDGELYVYHNRPSDPDPLRTLMLLYLEPLRLEVEKNNGKVYPGYSGPFQLMIDIKTEAGVTYDLIQKQLDKYKTLFERIEKGEKVPGPIMVFLSGNRPLQTILESDTHIAKLDGRPEDLGKGFPATKMPVISERYGKVIKWNEKGAIPGRQRKQLKMLIGQVHEEDKQIRLWAIPEQEKAWSVFLQLGLDWINADDLGRLKEFFINNR